MKKSFKKSLKQKHGGFAMTVEVIATMALISVFVSLTLFILQAMNAQRYMNTVVASTATQAARYGGVNTTAYKASTEDTKSLLQDAKTQVDSILPNSVWHFTITGSPDKITNTNSWIEIKATYTLPNPFGSISKVTDTDNSQIDLMDSSFLGGTRSITMKVRSLVKAGDLL